MNKDLYLTGNGDFRANHVNFPGRCMAGQPIPLNIPLPQNKVLSRVYEPLVSLNKALL